MIVALLVLSLAMIVGGLGAMVLGWDIVLLERGWAMVIAGSVSASGGAVLLGLLAAIARLTQIQNELVQLRERAPAGSASPVIDPVSLVSSGLLAEASAPRVFDPPEPSKRQEPAFGEATKDAAPRKAPAVEAVSRSDAPVDSELSAPQERDRRPPVLVADRGSRLAAAPVEPSAGAATADDLFVDAPRREEPEDDFATIARPDWARGAESEPPQPDWAVDSAANTATKPQTALAVPKSPVIGTYNSGGNRYVMFADGSIEAETPEGTFTFSSLDELKEFIAAGGESGARAT